DFPNLPQNCDDLLRSWHSARIPSSSPRAPFPTELESQKRKAGPRVRYRDQAGLLRVERHADSLRLLADALQRSVGPLSPLWGVGREHDHVVQVSGIGDGVASSVEGVVQVVEREVREEW